MTFQIWKRYSQKYIYFFILCSESPVFGVDYSKSVSVSEPEQDAILRNPVAEMETINEIDESINNSSDAFTAYLAEGGNQDKLERPLVFSPELGLTIEQLRDGFTLDSLWQVLPPETSKKSQLPD